MRLADQVLAELKRNPEGVVTVQLAHRLGASDNNVRGALSKLRAEGKVTTTDYVTPNNQRAKLHKLT